ncbi:hypothetical protein FKW77_000818 [Venturia effusa]|uniref:ADP-ribosylation factor-like protein 2 n=1 Tax=Venturia effusa TaxID=50376 RepID=A0A517LPK4_9PEZI|nr:hypothetical protein FKW77_000818 [Venturia effusa]
MLSILRKARLKDKEMRILLLGLDAAGKTTICKKLLDEPIDGVSPTLGFIIKTIEYEGYKLNIWDVGGQKTLRTYWKNYFEKTDTLIWVVDSTDAARLEDCREELMKLLLEEALQLDNIKTHRWRIIACSAVSGLGLREGLSWVVQDARERLFLF